MSRGMASGTGVAGAGAGISTSTRSPPRQIRDARTGLPSTVTRPSSIQRFACARLTSGRRRVRATSIRAPLSESSTMKLSFRSFSGLIVTEGGSMEASGGSLLREAAKGEERERRGHHQKERDDLRGGEGASEDETSLEIASKELDDEPRERIAEDVRPEDLSPEL